MVTQAFQKLLFVHFMLYYLTEATITPYSNSSSSQMSSIVKSPTTSLSANLTTVVSTLLDISAAFSTFSSTVTPQVDYTEVPSFQSSLNTTAKATPTPALFSAKALALPSSNLTSSTQAPSSSSPVRKNGTLAVGLIGSLNVTTNTSLFQSFENSSLVVPPTGNGSSYASKCATAWQSFYRDNFAQSTPTDMAAFLAVNTGLYLETYKSTWSRNFYSTYTLCDGIPRATGNPTEVVTYTATHTLTFTPKAASSSSSPGSTITPAPPVCSINVNDCAGLYRTYDASIASIMKQPDGGQGLPWPDVPPCSFITTDCAKCTIYGGTVQLIYFPTTANRDMCATVPSLKRRQQIVARNASEGQIVTAVYGGTVFSANSVYISFETAFASDECAHTTVGKPHPGAIIALASSDISSLRFPYFQANAGVSFDYADLNSPVPWSAYAGQYGCFEGWCSTIYDDYAPTLVVPDEIRTLDPAWAGCDLNWKGLYDPPMALTAVGSLLEPTPVPAAAIVQASPKLDTATMTSTSSSMLAAISSFTKQGTTPSSPSDSKTVSTSTPVTTPASPTAAMANPAPESTAPKPSQFPSSCSARDTRVAPGITSQPTLSSQGLPIATITASTGTATIEGLVLSVPASQSNIAVLGESTLSLGGSAIIVSGTTFSLGSSGIVVAAATATSTYMLPGASANIVPVPITFTLDGQLYTASQVTGGAIQIGSITISASGPAMTLSNDHVISAALMALVLDGTTFSFSTPASSSPMTIYQQPGPTPAITIGSTTLRAGDPAVTIDGHIFSLGSAALVVDYASTYAVFDMLSGAVPTTMTMSAGGDGVAVVIASVMGLSSTTLSAKATSSTSLAASRTSSVSNVVLAGLPTSTSTSKVDGSTTAGLEFFQGHADRLSASKYLFSLLIGLFIVRFFII